MANTQLWVNTGKDYTGNNALAGKTFIFGLSSQAFATFTAVDTWATRMEVTYWTGGANLTAVCPAPVNGAFVFSAQTFNTGAHSDGPASVGAGFVGIGTTLLYVVDLPTLCAQAIAMNTVQTQLVWTPEPLFQNVGGG